MSVHDRVRPSLAGLAAYHLPPVRAEVKLDANESPYPPDPALLAAFAEAVRTAPFERYPDPQASRVRELIARDVGRPGDWLVLGNGSDELITLLCQTFAAPQQDGSPGVVAWPAPSFVVYKTAALAAGLDVAEPLLGPRFSPDPEAAHAVLSARRPNLFFLATPNNPTGTEWPRATIEALLTAHPETLFIIDEAYVAYGRDSHLDLLDRFENCAILRTWSKIGLAALRLGFLVARPALAAEVEKVRSPYNLGLLPQLAAELALGPFRHTLDSGVAEVIAEREKLFAALSEVPGVEAFPSGANLILIRVKDAQRLWQRLLAQSVLVRNLDRPGPLAGCLRVTVGTPPENARFLAALHNAMNDVAGAADRAFP